MRSLRSRSPGRPWSGPKYRQGAEGQPPGKRPHLAAPVARSGRDRGRGRHRLRGYGGPGGQRIASRRAFRLTALVGPRMASCPGRPATSTVSPVPLPRRARLLDGDLRFHDDSAPPRQPERPGRRHQDGQRGAAILAALISALGLLGIEEIVAETRTLSIFLSTLQVTWKRWRLTAATARLAEIQARIKAAAGKLQQHFLDFLLKAEGLPLDEARQRAAALRAALTDGGDDHEVP